MEFSFVLATQTNSKSSEDVSQIIDPEWFVEKSAVKTDIQVTKRPQTNWSVSENIQFV